MLFTEFEIIEKSITAIKTLLEFYDDYELKQMLENELKKKKGLINYELPTNLSATDKILIKVMISLSIGELQKIANFLEINKDRLITLNLSEVEKYTVLTAMCTEPKILIAEPKKIVVGFNDSHNLSLIITRLNSDNTYTASVHTVADTESLNQI